MIKYSLHCDRQHRFDSWFQSAAAYDALAAARQLECPTCGSAAVDKAPMAPPVAAGRREAATPAPAPDGKLAALKRKIEAESTYVGRDFAREARAIHEGEVPERSIYGEAAPAEARALIEDGVPVAPLPFIPSRKSN
ncbi:DUF1178 family protein [Rhodobacteraceae bacterium CCMM004]|nr:DUF1178 family protein [Rhodobacteraceae bacterium CCMM004]